jgi:hypothetical protein
MAMEMLLQLFLIRGRKMQYNEYHLLELFENEPISIAEKEAGIFMMLILKMLKR